MKQFNCCCLYNIDVLSQHTLPPTLHVHLGKLAATITDIKVLRYLSHLVVGKIEASFKLKPALFKNQSCLEPVATGTLKDE